jgi:5-formyltetrahydrofolate cyclo-ligase
MIEDIRTQKKNLRKKILALRDAIPSEERRKKSASIHLHLFSLSEVLTESMIREALALPKVVAVPTTDLTNRRLLFSRIIDYTDDLVPGTWGIMEPHPDRVRPVTREEIDLVVTPGAVFDQRGQRIGYGGGFYDGLLKSFHKPSVALAYAVQIIEEVPTVSGHDQPVDIIITEKGIIRCKK